MKSDAKDIGRKNNIRPVKAKINHSSLHRRLTQKCHRRQEKDPDKRKFIFH